jgi:hypothetical protein
MYDIVIISNVFLTVFAMKSVIVRIMMSRDGTKSEVYLSKEIDPITMIIESINMQHRLNL